MNRVLVATTVLLFLFTPEVGLTAEGDCKEGVTGTNLFCSGELIDRVTGAISSVTESLSAPSSITTQKRYVAYERLSTNPDGQPCLTTGYREVPEDAGPLGEAALGLSDVDRIGNILAQYPACPEEPNQPNPVRETPAQIAARYWEEIPLPKPAPHIAPGWAITGKLAYLETHGELGHVYTNGTVVGPLEITATGTYYVDWGDGETSGPYTIEGKAWPDGQITHEYQVVGKYNVVVSERWTATWRLGGQSGTLRELRTTGRIDDFPVTQVQAVIR